MTHPIFAIPSHQCAKCGSAVYFGPISAVDESITHAKGFCSKCDVELKIPLTLVQCETVASKS